jgi:hypothetical protein
MYITDTTHQYVAQSWWPAGRQELSKSEEHIVPIRSFLKDAVFDPEVISDMSAAFEDVCKALEVSGRSDITKEMIATKIIQLVRGGETDPIVLRKKVLGELGLSQLPEEP